MSRVSDEQEHKMQNLKRMFKQMNLKDAIAILIPKKEYQLTRNCTALFFKDVAPLAASLDEVVVEHYVPGLVAPGHVACQQGWAELSGFSKRPVRQNETIYW